MIETERIMVVLPPGMQEILHAGTQGARLREVI
jgi:hypothetical protein